jgi:hypothetical protein
VEPLAPPNRDPDGPDDPDDAAEPTVAARVAAPRLDDEAAPPDGAAGPGWAGMPDGALRPHSSQ